VRCKGPTRAVAPLAEAPPTSERAPPRELGVFEDPYYLIYSGALITTSLRMVLDGVMEGSLQHFLRQQSSESQPLSQILSSSPSPQEGSLQHFLRQPTAPTQSLQAFMRQQPTSSESQSRSQFLSLSPSPSSTSCSEADGSDVSMDQDDESVLEGDFLDVFLYPICPAEGLSDSRLCGRHFMGRSERRRRCTLCVKSEPRGSAAYESKISIVCRQCNVYLHFDCFEEYHTRARPVSQWVGDV
jgi:hypothetical protein